jgi:hypothetical protein
MELNIKIENCTHELKVHIQELKGKLETFHQTSSKHSSTTYVDNQLKEFEKLFLDNVLLKVHNQALAHKNPKWKHY